VHPVFYRATVALLFTMQLLSQHKISGWETNTRDDRTRLKWLIVCCRCWYCWRYWKFRGHTELGV